MDSISAFMDAITGAGLSAPADLIGDGALHRFATNGKRGDDSGWYVLHLDGIPAGSFGDWKTGLAEKWHAGIERKLTAEERKQYRRRMRAVERQREEATQQRHAEAAAQAAEVIQGLQPAPADHPYFQKKGIHADVLVDADGQLVVPVSDGAGNITSLQIIDDDGEKRFLPGGRVTGCFYPIGKITDLLYIAEGLATAASVHAATAKAVAVAFNAGNLKAVADAMRARYPALQLIVAADNDVRDDGSENTGIVKATAAAQAVGGLVAIPQLDGQKCDFNDVHRIKGLECVAEQLAEPSHYTPQNNRATVQPPPALALETDILGRFRAAIRGCGVVGEAATAATVYLVITSRLLEKPVSLAIKGLSSSGKSYTTEKTVAFFPPGAVIVMTAMSERSLVYSKEEYSHRTLILYEAAALREGAEDNLTAYFVRSLLSEGRIEYPVTVRDPAGGFTTKTIIKEGPTNLIVTTTKTRIHAENETRLLSLSTDDSREQTKEIFRALASATESRPDLTDWLQLQSWLQSAEHRVTIPYAARLAELVPPVAVRMRRDFGAVLALIRSHAILHQMTRERGLDGSIIATVDDYDHVRELIAPIIAEGVGATISETVRETVDAVSGLATNSGVMALAIAEKLRLDKGTISRRLRVAADGGYIRNLEDKRGKPGRWVIGDPLPEETELLPQPCNLQPPETRASTGGCTVAGDFQGVDRQVSNAEQAEYF